MENKAIFKANIKRHRGALIGVFILVFFACAALGTVLTVWLNSGRYVHSELMRAGFGSLTAWVSGLTDAQPLVNEVENLPEVSSVEIQNLIFSNYTVDGQESDSEGQLILYHSEDSRYRFFTDDLHGYQEQPETISPGEIYVSPSLVSMMGLTLGDEIRFPIARSGRDKVFTVAGFYEDPFMGSSMIGMKGFLIGEEDFQEIRQMIQSSGIDALARAGAMLHIFAADPNAMTSSDLNQAINDNTSLSSYVEFIHSEDAIAGFMLILQNAFAAMLMAFVAVLLLVVVIVLGHSISSGIEADYSNMGMLKTVGFTGRQLRGIWLAQYLTGILGGMAVGLAAAAPLSHLVSNTTLTTTGIYIPADLPIGWCLLAFGILLWLLMGFICLKTRPIRDIAPMKAIRGDIGTAEKAKVSHIPIWGTHLQLGIALRQLTTGKRRYVGACMVAVLLMFIASMIGRMDSWLGPDGKGMMDAFNPADHDIGVQMFGESSIEDAEEMIRSYSEITDDYLLAMPNVAVEGMDYTANVITEPEWFHILEGRTCLEDDEIVLTEFVAANLGVQIGDSVTVTGDSGSTEYIVSGIYSCANDMGDNVGMSREGYLKIGQDDPELWCHHYFLEDTTQKAAITAALENTYGGDIHIHENTWPGLFGIISAMQALMVFLYVMVAVFILVVTVLTGSKLLAAEQRDMGIYKALGFTNRSLRLSFSLRFAMVALLGSTIGLILANFLTDTIVSAAMKLAGISNFASAPSVVSVLLPALTVTLLFAGFAFLTADRLKRIDVTILISE